jgi:hypothetical protein
MVRAEVSWEMDSRAEADDRGTETRSSQMLKWSFVSLREWCKASVPAEEAAAGKPKDGNATLKIYPVQWRGSAQGGNHAHPQRLCSQRRRQPSRGRNPMMMAGRGALLGCGLEGWRVRRTIRGSPTKYPTTSYPPVRLHSSNSNCVDVGWVVQFC